MSVCMCLRVCLCACVQACVSVRVLRAWREGRVRLDEVLPGGGEGRERGRRPVLEGRGGGGERREGRAHQAKIWG